MFIPSTFKRPVSSWKALNLRKTLLMASSVCRMTFPILASLLVRLVVLLPFQLLRLSLATPGSEERFSRNAETDLVCRLLLGKHTLTAAGERITGVAQARCLI